MLNIKELSKALKQVAEEKGLEPGKVLEVIESSIADGAFCFRNGRGGGKGERGEKRGNQKKREKRTRSNSRRRRKAPAI